MDDPGFDKDHWPSIADAVWGMSTHSYYNRQPYWQATKDVRPRPFSDTTADNVSSASGAALRVD
jgi:hypothetical protein